MLDTSQRVQTNCNEHIRKQVMNKKWSFNAYFSSYWRTISGDTKRLNINLVIVNSLQYKKGLYSAAFRKKSDTC